MAKYRTQFCLAELHCFNAVCRQLVLHIHKNSVKSPDSPGKNIARLIYFNGCFFKVNLMIGTMERIVVLF